MKKIISISMASLMLVLTLCSCSCSVSVGDKTFSTDKDGKETTESAAESIEETSSASGQDALFTWKIKLDGVDYTLPFDVSELIANGYEIDPDKDENLNSRTYTIGAPNPKKDGKSLSVQHWNPTSEAKKYSECKIGQISVEVQSEHEIILPGNFKFDSSTTVQSILDMYGEPERLNEQEKYTTITYKQDIYSTVEFFIYTQDEKMMKYNSVTLKNLV